MGELFIAGQGEIVLHPTDVILSPPQRQALDVGGNLNLSHQPNYLLHMSMSLRLYTVSDSDIRDIEREPLRLEILYYGEILGPSALDELDESKKEQILKWAPEHKPDVLYIEAMFQSLHYLLTLETEWGKGTFPLNFLSGTRLDIGEIGWGAATFYTSDEVKQISAALENMDLVDLEKRYDADVFNENEIYPRGYKWMPSDNESLLLKLKETLKFINEAKDKSVGIFRVLV